ncbi:MAG: hypothetical protein OEY51_13255, partial [Cyclobacteriaceae bacterium]|nr:hypothetical protein [Cyclobacteriaceae bacterium]
MRFSGNNKAAGILTRAVIWFLFFTGIQGFHVFAHEGEGRGIVNVGTGRCISEAMLRPINPQERPRSVVLL